MKTAVTAVLTSGLIVLSSAATADTIGASATVSYWRGTDRGTVQKGGNDIDIRNDLGFKDDNFTAMSFSLEHPVPLLPDFKFQYFRMDQVGHGTIPSGSSYDGLSGNVDTNLDLSHYDVTLYYQLLDNWVHLDLGLTGKVFRGKLDVRQSNNSGQTSHTDINKVIPMVYAATRFELPTTGLSVGAEGSGIAYSGNHAYDVSAFVDYRIVVLDLQAGYRQLAFNVDNVSGINADVRIGGPYVKLGVAF